MCNYFINSGFNLLAMNPRYSRLLQAAKVLKHAEKPVDVARLLNISEQTLTNWKSRGIPDKEINTVSRAISCHPYWLENGDGDMEDGFYVRDEKLKQLLKIAQELPEYAKDKAIRELADLAELIEQASRAAQQ